VPTSKVEVWNLAQSRVGDTDFIESETADDPSAQVCRVCWDTIVNATFEAVQWPFATTQAALTSLGADYRTGWDYGYQLPADCAKPIALLNEGDRVGKLTRDARYVFEIQLHADGETGVLLTDLEADDFDVLEYVAYVTYIGRWSGQFTSAVAWRLAAELALGIKKDTRLAQAALQAYDRAIAFAAANDFNNQVQDQPQTTPSVVVRS